MRYLGIALSVLLLVSCGGDDGPTAPTPAPTPAPSPAPSNPAPTPPAPTPPFAPANGQPISYYLGTWEGSWTAGARIGANSNLKTGGTARLVLTDVGPDPDPRLAAGGLLNALGTFTIDLTSGRGFESVPVRVRIDTVWFEGGWGTSGTLTFASQSGCVYGVGGRLQTDGGGENNGNLRFQGSLLSDRCGGSDRGYLDSGQVDMRKR
jgi:hypothetical protein